MTSGRPVVVKRLPQRVSQHEARELLREIEPSLKDDHPSLVFDFTDVRHLDSAGIELLLHCMEEAMKRNGDLKFAAVPPAIGAILELTRVHRLFEIFDNAADAAESFYRFPAHAFQQTWEATHPSIRAENGERNAPSSEGPEEQ